MLSCFLQLDSHYVVNEKDGKGKKRVKRKEASKMGFDMQDGYTEWV